MNDMRKLMEAVQLDERASSEQWEIAIENLIGEGENRYAVAGATIEEKSVWQWVSSELHGMLDFQPDESGLSSLDRWPSDKR